MDQPAAPPADPIPLDRWVDHLTAAGRRSAVSELSMNQSAAPALDEERVGTLGRPFGRARAGAAVKTVAESRASPPLSPDVQQARIEDAWIFIGAVTAAVQARSPRRMVEVERGVWDGMTVIVFRRWIWCLGATNGTFGLPVAADGVAPMVRGTEACPVAGARPMIVIDGCSYLGCEDVATAHQVIRIDGEIVDAFLCPNHGPYVQTSLRRTDYRTVIVNDSESRTRVVVRPPVAA
jgi:hypothetical protein